MPDNLFEDLNSVVPLEDLHRWGCLRLTSRGYLPLWVDVLGGGEYLLILSLGHYHVVEGLTVADPGMMLEVDLEAREVRPLAITWSDNRYRRAVTWDAGREVVNAQVLQDIRDFLRRWLIALHDQGYTSVEEDPALTRADNGRETLP